MPDQYTQSPRRPTGGSTNDDGWEPVSISGLRVPLSSQTGNNSSYPRNPITGEVSLVRPPVTSTTWKNYLTGEYRTTRGNERPNDGGMNPKLLLGLGVLVLVFLNR